MKLFITTVYENVDADWLNWWLEKHGPIYGIPNDVGPEEEFGHAVKSKDPTSEVVGTTTISMEK